MEEEGVLDNVLAFAYLHFATGLPLFVSILSIAFQLPSPKSLSRRAPRAG